MPPISDEDRAEIDAVVTALQATFADMDRAIGRAPLTHFLDLVEDGQAGRAISLYGFVDPDFDEGFQFLPVPQ